jgi:hypothetical protein
VDNQSIFLSDEDATQISSVLEGLKQSCLPDQFQIALLKRTMEDARVVASDLIPPDTVVIHCAVRVVDLQTGKMKKYTLVLPELADMAKRQLSVTAPLGIALLGHKGEVVEANVPGGRRLLKIERVRHLPRRTDGHRSRSNGRTPQHRVADNQEAILVV